MLSQLNWLLREYATLGHGHVGGLCWAHVALMLCLDWAILDLSWVVWKRWGAVFGPFYLRAKNDLFFRANKFEKLDLEGPMLGSCRAFIGPCWGCLGPWLSYWVYLGPFGSGEGQFLGPFFRAKNHAIFSTKKLGLEGPMLGSCRAFIGPCWGCLGPWLSYWVYLAPFGSGEGQFLGPFFRAKNHAILSTKKLGLEGPMLGSCRAFIGPRWGYLGHWLSLSGSISGPRIGCWRICSWEENVRWVLWVLMIIYWDWLEQRPSLESSGFLYKI